MEDEHKEQPTPARSRLKMYKILTISLFFFILLIAVGYVGVEATSSSKFCSSCHQMKPEAQTWKASSHSQVDCKDCHIQSGVINYAKAKINGVKELYEIATDSYSAPIHMPDQIPNATCEKCHNMKTRQSTPSGDLIIPHEKHLKKGIKCVQCHSGVAHGKIAYRNVTYKTDYGKWNTALGKSMMSDKKYTDPNMQDCIDCHKERKVSATKVTTASTVAFNSDTDAKELAAATECKTCHTTGMLPKSHKKADFKTKTHGLLAKKDIAKCNSCHKYMTTKTLTGYGKISTIDKYLNSDAGKQAKDASTYAKENTFCQNCHSKRPASHVGSFIDTHGTIASKDQTTCAACHNTNNTAKPLTTNTKVVNCSTCHQIKHPKNWRDHHPISVANVKRPEARCYSCHAQNTCATCHDGKLN